MKQLWARFIGELHEQLPTAKRGWLAILVALVVSASGFLATQLSTKGLSHVFETTQPPLVDPNEQKIAPAAKLTSHAFRIVSVRLGHANGFEAPKARPPLLGALKHEDYRGDDDGKPDHDISREYISGELSQRLSDERCFRPDGSGYADEKGYINQKGDWKTTRGWRMPTLAVIIQNTGIEPLLLAGFLVKNGMLEVELAEGGPSETLTAQPLRSMAQISVDLLDQNPSLFDNEIVIQPGQYAKFSVALKASLGERSDYLGLVYGELMAVDAEGRRSSPVAICVQLPQIATGATSPIPVRGNHP